MRREDVAPAPVPIADGDDAPARAPRVPAVDLARGIAIAAIGDQEQLEATGPLRSRRTVDVSRSDIEGQSFVLDEAVQIHGGFGYMRDTEINRLYRTGKVMEIAAGTQEIRKLIIARALLKGEG